jgi:hypothetical protein
MKRRSIQLIVTCVVGVLVFACARHVEQTAATATPAAAGSKAMDAATAPAAQDEKTKASPGGKFSYPQAGIGLTWPSGWEQSQLESYEWTIFPAGEKSSQQRWISLDVPTLPWHPPGMIPITRVEKGYVDDLKKEFGTLDVKELTPPNVADSKLRCVRCGWQKDGKSMEQTALLIVHDDHVYILRSRSDAEHEQATRECFDSVVSSITWKK